MRLSRAIASLAVAATALATIAGCGSAQNATSSTSGESPAQAAQAGLTSLLDGNALTATMTLDADPATLAAVFGADQDAKLTGAQAGSLAGATVVLAVKTRSGSLRSVAGSPSPLTNTSLALSLSTRATPKLVQVVAAKGTLYARADLDHLLALVGSPQMSGLLHSPNLPPSLAALAAGQWVSLDLADLDRSDVSTPSVGPSQAAGLAQSLDAIFQKDVTVTRAAPDPTRGDHLVLSGNVRTIGTDVLSAVSGLLGSMPNASGLLGSAPQQLPDKTIRVDEYVRNGTASAFRIDLTQLLNPSELKAAAGHPAALDVDLAATATVQAPGEATPLTGNDLTGLVGSLLSSVAS